MKPCIVYLDTSDYSRFGDVLRGKGSDAEERLYTELRELKESGAAIFPCSAPMLAELLQYDDQHRRTTICKAQAVEALAAGSSFILPPRMIALEVAQAAQSVGLLDQVPQASVLSSDWDWTPNIGNALAELKEKIQGRLATTIAESGYNRQLRRAAKATARKWTMSDYAEAAEQVVPQFSRKWGLSEESVRTSIVAAIMGKVSTDRASKILFAEISRPTAFVDVYFEHYEGPKDLPFWMSNFGVKIQESALKLREAVALMPPDLRPILLESFRAEVSSRLSGIGGVLIGTVDEDAEEFGVTPEIVQRFASDKNLADLVPSSVTITKLMMSFALENAREPDAGHGPQRSTGGDFIHALYARYSDLWRGDRRFSHFLREAVPELAHRIVPKLSDLPARIRRFNEQAEEL